MGASNPSVLLFACVVLALSCCSAVRDGKYYKLLGVDPDADEYAIKKAYRRLAM